MVGIVTIAGLLLLNAVLTYQSRQGVLAYNEGRDRLRNIDKIVQNINTDVKNTDLGFRGFYIVPEDKFMIPYTHAVTSHKQNLDSLESLLRAQGYPHPEEARQVKQAISEYIATMGRMIEWKRQGNEEAILEVFQKDPGYDLYMSYTAFFKKVDLFLAESADLQEAHYKAGIKMLLIVQVLLIGLGLPILIWVVYRLNQVAQSRHKLFAELAQSNRQYIFSDGNTEATVQNEQSIINGIIGNLQTALQFIHSITNGNYQVEWSGLNASNQHLNQRNLAGELLQMRDQMQQVKAADERRLWATEGISKVSEITRLHQNEVKELSEKLLAFVVKYLGANQGGIFILSEDENDPHLRMTGCYAYDKKRILEQRIEIGSGMVGQAYLEGETVRLREVPQQYVNITSGLGEATPGYLLIVPLKFNEQVLGVIEVASFKELAEYQANFVEEIGEAIAAAVSMVRTKEQTQHLLEQMRGQTEQMSQQEEEMRQNMEELIATQEEMERKAKEYQEIIQQYETEREKA